MNSSFTVSKEMLYGIAEVFAPFFIGAIALIAVLIISVLWTSPSGDLRLDVISMDIRHRFNKKWFTFDRVTEKLFPNSDPCYVRAAINFLVEKGELRRYENPRNGHQLYHFA